MATEANLDMVQLFKMFDANNDQKFSFSEFFQICCQVDPNIPIDKIQNLFKQLDTDRSQSLSQKEFLSVLAAIDLEKHHPHNFENLSKNQEKELQAISLSSIFQKFQQIKQLNAQKQINIQALLDQINQAHLFYLTQQQFTELLNLCIPQAFTENEVKYFFKSIQSNYITIEKIQEIFGLPKQSQQQVQQQQNQQQEEQKQSQKSSQQQLIVNKLLQPQQSIETTKQMFKNFYDISKEDENLPGIKEFISAFAQCEKTGQKFVDNSFPPTGNSLWGANAKKQAIWKSFVWRRPEEFLKGQFHIFEKPQAMIDQNINIGKLISVDDIQQGELGDCYFLASLSEMAYVPERILKLFITKTINKYGIYCIKFCLNGEWQAIVIDDNFPCKNNRMGPCFTRGNGNEIWVMLLEKAFAKFFGSYAKIESGSEADTMRDLTGASTEIYQTKILKKDEKVKTNNPELLPLLKTGLMERDFLCSAAISKTQSELNEIGDLQGLIVGHAYSLIEMYIIQDKNGQHVDLIQLRNPWGHKEWEGDWSDKSPLWTDILKKQVHFSLQDDGCFFMDYRDFQKYYSDVTFCFYYRDYLYNSIRLSTPPNKASYTQVLIETPGKYYFSINQKNERLFKDSLKDYNYSRAQILLLQILPGNKANFIAAKQSSYYKDLNVYSKLEQGKYLIYSKIQWETGQSGQFVLSSYGPAKLNFEQVEKQTGHCIVNSAIKFKAEHSQTLKQMDAQHYPQVYYGTEFDPNTGFGYIYAQNNGQEEFNGKATLKLKGFKPVKTQQGNYVVTNYVETPGGKARKPYPKDTTEYTLKIGGHSDFIVVFKVNNEQIQNSVSFSYSYKVQH